MAIKVDVIVGRAAGLHAEGTPVPAISGMESAIAWFESLADVTEAEKTTADVPTDRAGQYFVTLRPDGDGWFVALPAGADPVLDTDKAHPIYASELSQPFAVEPGAQLLVAERL